MFPFPTSRTSETILLVEAGIAGFWDSAFIVIRGTGADIVYSSTSQCGLEESVPVPGCCVGASLYIGRP